MARSSIGSARSVLRYYSHFFPLSANRPQLADEFVVGTYSKEIQRVAVNKQNRLQAVDDFKLLFFTKLPHVVQARPERAEAPSPG